jgi:6-phosphogluconolactonase
MALHIYKNPDEFSHAVARWITDLISSTLKKQDHFSFVLSGGNTPKALFSLLAASPYREQIEWSKLHIFWGDERAVPFSDERNNARMAFDSLLSHVNIPASQIHVMRTDIPPEQSAADYEKILRVYFDSEPSDSQADSFDLVLLGMGDDGHTLSLFPGTEVVHEEKAWVRAYYLEAQDMYRITLTKPIVNRSTQIAFLTTGANKAHALREVIKGKYNPDLYPSQEIHPDHGELHWFLDEAAASLLN